MNNIKFPKVSIIVPNYNYERYLPERLNSIFGQTFTDYEVILLDDCSTDSSADYLREQSVLHPQVTHCILGEINTGNPFVQWEKGISLARGEYIWIAESDDYCEVSFLSKMVALLDAHPDAAYSMCGSHLVNESDAPLDDDYDRWEKGDNDMNAYKYSSKQYLKHFLLWYNGAYNASMILFRKQMFLQIQMDFSSMRYCGDWMFWIKMAEKGSVIILHERLNYFRRHSKSVTFNSDGMEKQLREKLLIYTYLWDKHHFGLYRDFLSRGYLYKEIMRIDMSREKKLAVICRLSHYGVNKWAFIFERLVKTLQQMLGFIPAPKYDFVLGQRIGRVKA